MSQLTAISQALDFVERHLKADVSVADMAGAASYSLYHFSRVFNRLVHHTPYDYLMRRRLSESARERIESDKRIIDIAFDYQFNNPETYSRAFQRMFGLQPSQWKEREQIDRRLLMNRLTRAHLEYMDRTGPPRPALVTWEARRVVGVMTLVQSERALPLQEVLAAELRRIDARPAGDHYYAITWYPHDWRSQGMLRLLAVELAAGSMPPTALAEWTIPAARYVHFAHRGRPEERDLMADYIYQTWLPKSGERLAYPFEVERFDRSVFEAQPPDTWAVYVPLV